MKIRSYKLLRNHKIVNSIFNLFIKVENILKGSLDLISSPFPTVKIQIIGGKIYFRYEGNTYYIAGCQQTICYQMFVYNTQQCFAFTPQANFPRL